MYENHEYCIAFMSSSVRMSIFAIMYELIRWMGVIMINFMILLDCLIFYDQIYHQQVAMIAFKYFLLIKINVYNVLDKMFEQIT